MSAIFTFILVTTSVMTLIMKKYRYVFIILCFNIFVSLGIGIGLVPRILLAGLQIHPPLTTANWKENNLIVLLGAGAVKWSHSDYVSLQMFAYSRVHEAARLYYNCRTQTTRCHILISGGDPANNGTAEAELMLTELKKIGVKVSDITTESQSNNTFQNALFSSEIINKKKFDRLILVTSGTHMNRALRFFLHFGIELTPAPADHLSVHTSWKYLYQNFFLTDLALHEYVGLLKYQISK